jgi:hypothetical protein
MQYRTSYCKDLDPVSDGTDSNLDQVIRSPDSVLYVIFLSFVSLDESRIASSNRPQQSPCLTDSMEQGSS